MMQTPRDSQELLALLSEEATSAEARQRTYFDHLAGSPTPSIVLFGAGALGRKVLACLRRYGIVPVALADNDMGKWGKRIDDLEVQSPEQAAGSFGRLAVFVVTIASPGCSFLEVRRQLTGLGCARVPPVLPLMWKYQQDLLPHYAFDVPSYFLAHRWSIMRAFSLLADDLSRRSYIAHLRLRLRADFESLPEPQLGNQYFPEDLFSLRGDEVFVDGGAYDGDTIRALLTRSPCKRIHAFEPDPGTSARLRAYLKFLGPQIQGRAEVMEVALGKQTGVVCFNACGEPGSAACPSGPVEVPCVRLDDLAFPAPPTFIKLDIEGAERDALMGARRLIDRHHPVIAISVYHRPDDLWQVPALLAALHPEYAFFLRWHGFDGWETVLYAVPPERILAGPRECRCGGSSMG